MVKFEFDPNSKLSYGEWYCPTCKSEFYGPGVTFHERDCPLDTTKRNDFSQLVYRYTQIQLDAFNAGEEFIPHSVSGLREAMEKQNHRPEVVP
jgi:hypothetical protein